MKKIGQLFGFSFISQVPAFLNAALSPFKGTIFAFDDWEPMASKSAVAVGFVILPVIVALNLGASKTDLIKCTIVAVVITLILFGICGIIYFVLKTGFAPTVNFLFLVRNIVWMIVYFLALVMVGITIAFAQLLLYFGVRKRAG